MFKASQYERRDELVMRLRNSVIMLGKRPVYINQVRDDRSLRAILLRTGEAIDIPPEEFDKLNLEVPAMGYVNSPKGAYYVKRNPSRMYKQGITLDNVRFLGAIQHENPLMTKGFACMLQNVYPTFDEAVRKSSGNPFRSHPTAFHKMFAVHGSNLFYKGQAIGNVRPDKTYRLSAGKEYLREIVEEVLNG